MGFRVRSIVGVGVGAFLGCAFILYDNNKSPKHWVIFLNNCIELGLVLGLVLNQGGTEDWD